MTLRIKLYVNKLQFMAQRERDKNNFAKINAK